MALPDFELLAWFGAVGPAGIPKPVVARLHQEFARALAVRGSREKLFAAGFEVDTATPEEFGVFLRTQSETWGRIIRQHNISAE